MKHRMPEGTTEPQGFTLLAKGDGDLVPEGFDLTAASAVGIEIYDKDGELVEGAGEVAVIDAGAGKVAFNPVADEEARLKVAASPYSVRWVATIGGKVYKIPNSVPPANADPDIWEIVR